MAGPRKDISGHYTVLGLPFDASKEQALHAHATHKPRLENALNFLGRLPAIFARATPAKLKADMVRLGKNIHSINSYEDLAKQKFSALADKLEKIPDHDEQSIKQHASNSFKELHLEVTEKIAKIDHAKETLTDTEKRAAYDKQCEQASKFRTTERGQAISQFFSNAVPNDVTHIVMDYAVEDVAVEDAPAIPQNQSMRLEH